MLYSADWADGESVKKYNVCTLPPPARCLRPAAEVRRRPGGEITRALSGKPDPLSKPQGSLDATDRPHTAPYLQDQSGIQLAFQTCL